MLQYRLSVSISCLFLFVTASFLSPLAYAGILEIGVGVADITPDVATCRVPMAGYGSRLGRPSTGVRDSLYAKVLYLSDGRQHMALITADLRSSTPEFKAHIVQKTAELGLTQDNVFIAASHTHAGPSMYPEKFWQMQFGRYDPAIVDIMTSAIAEAAHHAAVSTTPATMGYAVGSADGFTRNRRWSYSTEQRVTNEEKPVVDPRLTVIRFDSMAGRCLALVVHFAAHPTILSASNMHLSAEWPGVLQRELETTFPECRVFYLNGAAGDQSPVAPDGADEFERMENYGKRLAGLAATLAETAETKPGMPIQFAHALPELPPLTFPESAGRKFEAYAAAARDALPRRAEIQLMRIGPILLAGMPGEPIMEVGQAVEKHLAQAGFEMPIAVGLANDYIGYIVNEKEYAHGGYEVESRSYYGPLLGDFHAQQFSALVQQITNTVHGALPPP